MLQTNDIGLLFASLQAVYGHKFAHQADAIPIWQNALRECSVRDIKRGANEAVLAYPDFPPTLGQFLRLLNESAPRVPCPDDESATLVERIYAYTRPASARNSKGNLHGVTLPESIARRRQTESPEQYSRRIAGAVTFALYPAMRAKFQRE